MKVLQMRVLVNTPDISAVGGVANYYKVLRPYLGPDVEYFIVASRPGEKGGFSFFRRLFRDYWDFACRLRRGHFDLVHLNPSLLPKALLRDAGFLLLAKACGKKVVILVHGWDLRFERSIEKRFLFLFRMIYFRADAFVVLASAFQKTLRRWGYNRPVLLETTAVEDEEFASEAAMEQRADPDRKRVNILFLSRVEREKGIFVALESYRLLKEKCDNISLTIAGDGPGLAEARRYAEQNQIRDVSFTGFVMGEQKRAAFLEGDIYLFPSFGEGMPTSVLEAMAYGLPVVTRPTGGLVDLFEDSKMGFLIESLSPPDYVPVLERLISDRPLRERMGVYNREFASEHFRASRVAQRIRAMHASVMREYHKTPQTGDPAGGKTTGINGEEDVQKQE